MERALQAALTRRRAAQQAGLAPPRRRRMVDVEDDGGPESRVTALGWPDAAVGGPPNSPVGWPGLTHSEPALVPAGEPDSAGGPDTGTPAPTETATTPTETPASVQAPASIGTPPGRPSAPEWSPPASGRPSNPTGWRKVVRVLSRGALNPGDSAAELGKQQLLERIRVPTTGCRRIAVISLKGGVGKTTMSVCLGAMLASVRSDRVVAVDANPDRGTLSGKVPQQTQATIRDLLDQLQELHSYADVSRFTSQSANRLEVLASAADPAISDAFGEQDYRRVLAVLERFYSLVITDCGTGLLHSAMVGVLDLADQLVVVSTNSVDGANSASATLDWLQAHGRAGLVAGSVAVINSVVPGSGAVDIDRLEAHFASRCRAVTRIPHDTHLETGAEVELGQLRRPTREALLRLAAQVADGFPTRSAQRPLDRAL